MRSRPKCTLPYIGPAIMGLAQRPSPRSYLLRHGAGEPGEGGVDDGMGNSDPWGMCPGAWGLPPFGIRRRSSAPGV